MPNDQNPLKCHLRPLRNSDIPYVYSLQHDKEAAAMAGVPGRFLTKPEFTASMASFLEANVHPPLVFAIIFETEMAGYIGCFPYGEQRYRVSFWIERAFWGRGITTQAMIQMLERLPKNLVEKGLEAAVIEGNVASASVLMRFGFAPVGTEEFQSAAHGRKMQQTLYRRSVTS